jgi:hypothetical protein
MARGKGHDGCREKKGKSVAQAENGRVDYSGEKTADIESP